jgi:hypothetical protein
MRKNIKLFLILSIVFQLFSSCKDKHPQEMKLLNALDATIDSTEIALNYDLITLNNRNQRIKFQMETFKRFNKETYSLETGNKLQRYKEVSKVYKQFINNFEDCFNSMKLSEKQSETLRNSVLDNKMSKEDFKKYYQEELSHAKINLAKARKISKFLPAMEPEFQRLNKEIDAMLNHIAKSDSALQNILLSE